jgi:hypothetical protein
MNAATTETVRNTPSPMLVDQAHNVDGSSPASGLDREEKDLLSIFCPMLGILLLAAIGIISISGQFPWFIFPLGIFLFFTSCLPWRQAR